MSKLSNALDSRTVGIRPGLRYVLGNSRLQRCLSQSNPTPSRMFPPMDENLKALAELLVERNRIDGAIAALIERPAERGHIGEIIAARIFNIKLCDSATHSSIDGHFMEGLLAGRSVNIKLYGKQESLLDLRADNAADFYLVLTGPKAAAVSSRGHSRPLQVDHVYLFDGPALIQILRHRAVKIGVATSVQSHLWDAAEIYPKENSTYPLTERQRQELSLFQPKYFDKQLQPDHCKRQSMEV